MTSTIESLATIGSWSLGNFWIPLIVWTLGALPAYVILRRARRTHPATQYTVHRALLLALPLTFVLIALTRLVPTVGLDTPLLSIGAFDILVPSVSPEVVAPQRAADFTQGILHLLGALTLAAAVLAVTRLAIILYRARHLATIHRVYRTILDPNILSNTNRLATGLGLTKTITILEGPEGVIPFTFGHRRPSVVVPANLLEDPATLNIVLEHELTHVVRSDFRAASLEHVVAAFFAIHPLLSPLLHRIAEFRELCCDRAVLSRRNVSARNYARVLLLFGAEPSAAVVAAVPMIVHPTSNIKSRINAMKNKSPDPSPERRWVTGILALALPALLAACSAQVANETAKDSVPTLSGVSLENADRDMDRLHVQMEYLTEEMNTLRQNLEQASQDGENVEMKPEFRRFHLLQSMYMQRLEAYETLKLEQETARRLGLIATPES